jgi:hypothetical protein
LVGQSVQLAKNLPASSLISLFRDCNSRGLAGARIEDCELHLCPKHGVEDAQAALSSPRKKGSRRLCEEVHLNLAYRWFCRLGLQGKVPDHSTFSKNRHGRFRESGIFRRLFETVVRRCMDEGLIGGEGFAVDATLIPTLRRGGSRRAPPRP